MRFGLPGAIGGLALAACGAQVRTTEVELGADARPSTNEPPTVEASRTTDIPTASDLALPEVRFVSWGDDVVDRAKRSGRPVLLVVCAAWAARCVGLGRDLFAQEDVRRMARSYLPAWLDATETSPEMDERVRGLRLSGFPAIVLIDPREDNRRALPASISAAELATELETFSRHE